MAQTDVKVRFYKISSMSAFNDIYKGIFVNLTAESTVGTGTSAVKYKKGLYFGGENGWEYLTNDTDVDNIQKMIDDSIKTLDATVKDSDTNVNITIDESNGVLTGVTVTEDYATISTAKSENNDTTLTVASADTGKLVKASDLSTVATFANTRISEEIAKLDVSSFAEATIEGDSTSKISTLTILGLGESDGEIFKDSDNNLVINIDGVYDAATNKIATQDTLTNAINALDASDIDLVNTTETKVSENDTHVKNYAYEIYGINETNGKIAKTNVTDTINVGDGRLYISGSAATTESGIPTASSDLITSANTYNDATIVLDSNTLVYVADSNTISVRTKTAASATNAIVTESDIASLSGAMHYKGSVSSTAGLPSDSTKVKAGDTYIVSEGFKLDNGTVLEVGDMIVYGTNGSTTDYTVVQSNITKGVKSGQIAVNDGDLTNKALVFATSTGITTNMGTTDSPIVYTLDAETTSGTTTISKDSSNTTLPTSKNVYDAIHSLAVESVAEATTLSYTGNVVTISDQLTVDGTAQTANTFNIGSGVYTDAVKTANYYTTAGVLIVDANDTNKTVTISHGNVSTKKINIDDSDTTTLAFTDSDLDKSFVVPTLKVDEYGHVYSEKNTKYTITLPSSIATAVQLVSDKHTIENITTGEDIKITDTLTVDSTSSSSSFNIKASGYIGVEAGASVGDSDLDYISFSLITESIDYASSENDGLATAYDVKTAIAKATTTVSSANSSIAVTGTTQSDNHTDYAVNLVWEDALPTA